jgi:myo-inositol-1(or 4)-monophosphatase
VKDDAAQLLAAAQLAADRGAAFLRTQEGLQGPERWSEKGRADFVTEVDRETERLITGTLAQAVPGGRVIGEELTPGTLPAGLVWVVDPLDGTTNFLHRFPYWAVSIAAVRDGEILAGVIDHVPRGIRYHAARGAGAFLDGVPLHVSTIAEPKHALIGTGFPFKYVDLLPRYQRQFAAILAQAAGIRRPGSAALDLCDVAAGRFDGFWELALEAWDVAAGTLIVREAGGRVTDPAGDAGVLRHGPIVAGNPAIHRWLLGILQASDAGALHPTP